MEENMEKMTRARLEGVIGKIEDLRKAGRKTVCVAIDGRAASGKTTLAAALQNLYPAADVIHMDDFFLPPELRTPERYAEPGGNVDYDRFRAEVSEKIGSAFAYRRFDCSRMAMGESVPVKGGGLVIVEGSYALNPKLGLKADITVFSEIDPETQLARIKKRNGEAKAAVFAAKWIPLEEAYFDALNVRTRCDLII